MSTSPDDLPPAVREALAPGNKLEAIKRLREATGFGPAEAKQRVEGTAPVVPSGGVGVSAHSLPADVIAALARGDKIGAIRLLREHTGLGLKEAKDHIDAAAAASSMPLSPEVPRAPTASWWVAALVALLAAAWFVLR